MKNLIYSLITLVAAQHFLFMILEMFFWTKPIGLKIFKNSESFSQSSAVLAANQGLYNSFLAAGLIWFLYFQYSKNSICFFLICIVIAGCYGGYSVSKNIFFIQTIPALATLALTYKYLN